MGVGLVALVLPAFALAVAPSSSAPRPPGSGATVTSATKKFDGLSMEAD